MILLAHAGHWLVNLLYVLPVVIVLAAAARAVIHDRRDRRHEQETPSEMDGNEVTRR